MIRRWLARQGVSVQFAVEMDREERERLRKEAFAIAQDLGDGAGYDDPLVARIYDLGHQIGPRWWDR